ncbi:MAG: response regulator, partial [Ktedonobacteraceae bacterium]
ARLPIIYSATCVLWSQSMKFLIIDDNPADRELVVRKLRKEFVDAEFIELGLPAGIDGVISQGGYDVVLTDYQLNWADGLYILRKVKEHYPDVPVVMFTGTGNEEVAVEGMKSGLSNYVLKQHLENLPFAIRESLEKAELRKQYDEAIQQLKASEERYREVFEQGLTGIFIFTPTGTILDCNSAFAHIFGFSSIAEAMQYNICDLYPDVESCTAFLKRVQREKRLEYYEAEMRKQNGDTLYVVANVVGDFDAAGNLVEIKSYLFDHTERKKLQEQFLHVQKMESLGQLVSGIAHDFNNMLGGILGHTERSLAKITPDSPLYDNLKHTYDITERAARMTRQLLAFSRRQILEPKDIDVNQVISDLLAFIGKILADRIEFIFTPDPALKAIHADPAQIEQVLMNLSINARDAMPDGGKLIIETCNVTLDDAFCRHHPGVQAGEYIRIAITDTGLGIDEKVRAHIFEPFFTTKEPGKGTGLGLAMVHGIVGQHDGYIDVDSKVGKGTTFNLYFPSVERAPVSIHTDLKVPDQVEGGVETLLLVEDDPDLRFLMQEVLKEYGYTIIDACDGEEGLQLFKQHTSRIALVIADVVTPKMRGNELYTKIREVNPDARFLFVSGYQANQISHNFVLDEGLNFLPKPFDLDDLAAKVREVLS